MLFCHCIFSPISIAITSLGEERANLCAFSTLNLFDLRLFGFVLFPLPFGVWMGWACDCGTPWTFLSFYGSTLRKVKARFFLDIISEKYHLNYFVSLHHLALGIPDHFDLISDPYRDSYFGCS